MANTPPINRCNPNRSLWSSVLIGAGVVAGIDEILFHQILQWHHFFDHDAPTANILSDGILHAAELMAIVAGCFLLTDLARRQQLATSWAWSGFFLGMGSFQLFDGIVSHKLLRLHQIRYDVDLFVYDLSWNVLALALLAVGIWLFRRASRLARC